MGQFLYPLRLERVEDVSADGRGTWRLLDTVVFLSAERGRIVVPAGFVTDLASVPRLPITYFLAGGLAHAAAVVHDWLYTSHELTRAQADAVFREAAQACGVGAWRAWIMWLGVRVGGWAAWGAPGPEQPESLTNEL